MSGVLAEASSSHEPVAPVVALRAASRVYPTTPPVQAFAELDLHIDAGEYLSIVGPSGSGKSTLLHVLGCLDTLSEGSYEFEGLEVRALSDNERTAVRGRRIGFVFQSFHLMSHRSARENVEAAALYDGTPRARRSERAVDALQRVGLGHRLDFHPRVLSGGEAQRVAIARALASGPSLLLADEPSGNLDTATTAEILDLLDELCADGLTLVIVTHDEHVSRRAQRTLRMVDGVLTEDER